MEEPPDPEDRENQSFLPQIDAHKSHGRVSSAMPDQRRSLDEQTEEVTRSEMAIQRQGDGDADVTQFRNDSMMSVTEDMKIFNQDDNRQTIDADEEDDNYNQPLQRSVTETEG